MTMPFDNESVEDFLERCRVLAGERLPRATPLDIERLKSLGYSVTEWSVPTIDEHGEDCEEPYYGAQGPNGWFQDDEPSLREEDSWALCLDHSHKVERKTT